MYVYTLRRSLTPLDSIFPTIQVLRRLSFHESSVHKAVVRQGAIAGTAYLLTYILLALRQPKFEAVRDPEETGKHKKKKAAAAAAASASSAGPPAARPTVAVVRGGGSGGAWKVKAGQPVLSVGPKLFL